MKAVFAIALLFLAFAGGIAVSYLHMAPYRLAVSAWDQIKAMMQEPDRLMPIRYDYEGVKVHDAAAVAPGSTFITSYFPEFDWNAGARLIDAEGKVLHRWRIDPDAIFGGSHTYPYIHGSHLFPNGDVLVNFEFIGMARVTACGEVIWSIAEPKMHHSISAAADGTFWASGNRVVRSAEGRDEALFRILSLPVYEDLFVNVDADGKVLRSISSIEVFDRNGMDEVFVRMARRHGGDIFHLNDVEALSPEMAADYPLFEAGDIAVSLRDLNLVMVLDPETLKVKWYSFSDTLSQHDVDFIGGGWLGIFDNHYDLTDGGRLLGGSRILGINPATGERKVLFPKEGSPPFYTKWSGKWQLLGNGNLLMTESRAGHALEVTAEGRPVWEWSMDHYSATEVPEVMEASRYPVTAADVAAWPACD